jgi:hypothetical protein
MAELTVQYERKLSDGNYGSEGLSLTYTRSSAEDGPSAAAVPTHQAQLIATVLRDAVLEFLGTSEAERVAYVARRELAGPPPQPVAPAAESQESLEDLPF